MVREKAKAIASLHKIDTIIIDGPPGIGCPVISTISGVDKVIIVTEPTISGFHDLKRVIELTEKFNLTPAVIINKFDLNKEMSHKMEEYCKNISINVIGKIAFDPIFIHALSHCKTIIEWDRNNDISKQIIKIYNTILNQ